MPLKIVEIEGVKYAALNESDDVIYTDADGKEIGHNGEILAARLQEVNAESAARRHKLKELEEKISTFDGIEDPAAAIKAMETVKNFDDKKLIDAGEVERIKTEAIEGTEKKYQDLIAERYTPLEGEVDRMQARLDNEIIANLFANSKFIKERMTVPASMIRSSFGEHFKIEKDQLVMRYPNGDEIFSKSRPGDKADFEEAMELLVDASPMREYILKGADHRGGTGGPGPGTGSVDHAGQKVIKRSEFEKLDPQRKIDLMTKEGFRVIDG